jgi:hypothetical protein
MCRWNPNALAHDVLASMARPPSAMDLDYCGDPAILVRSLPRSLVLFLLLPRPFPPPFSFTVTPPSSTFDPLHILMSSLVFPDHPAPQAASTRRRRLSHLLSTVYSTRTPRTRRCTATHSPHRSEPAARLRRRVPNAVPHASPAHIITHSPHPHSRFPPPMSPPRPPRLSPAQCDPAARSSRRRTYDPQYQVRARPRLLHRVPSSLQSRRRCSMRALGMLPSPNRLLPSVTHRDPCISAIIDAHILDSPERRRAASPPCAAPAARVSRRSCRRHFCPTHGDRFERSTAFAA